MIGMAACAASGVFLLLAYAFERSAWLSLAMIIVSRLALGFGESWVGTGSATWAIARVGPLHTARVISWNGICTYGGLALGAPLGVYLEQQWSMGALGGAVLLLGLAGLGMAVSRAAVAIVGGHRMAFKSVVLRVFPHGMALGLGSVGFGTLAAVRGAVLRQRVLGRGGACAERIRPRLHRRARCCSPGTITPLRRLPRGAGVLRGRGRGPAVAVAGAQPGCGLAGGGVDRLRFRPGVSRHRRGGRGSRAPAGSRGGALGQHPAFLDLALGVTGPIAGYISSGFGYPAIFLAAAMSVLAGGLRLPSACSATPRAGPRRAPSA